MAVTAAGALYSWGEANASELGIKDDETGEGALVQPIPKMVVKKEGGSWAAVSTACGGQHVCALFRKKE
jgi:regulator of chromosome condensation